jgi:hypothetical protein
VLEYEKFEILLQQCGADNALRQELGASRTSSGLTDRSKITSWRVEKLL